MTNNNLKFVNVYDDDSALYDYCKANGLTSAESYEDFYESGGELAFFEGDPDMVKIGGYVGYFAKCGNIVFYYLDEFYGDAKALLTAFFNAFNTGITLGGESYLNGTAPIGFDSSDEIQNWDAWEKIENGIAYRGGAGYSYKIYDCEDWIKENC